ncbi:MAG TPA: DUF2232 domain-containing protein [Gemmatimonadaceae bacterium]|jgi:hypothetical protein
MTSPARATPEPLSAVAPPPASRERGWRGVLGALFALVILPTIPQLRLLTPIDQVLLLIAPAMAVCAVAAWWRGGRIGFALLWLVLAAWIVAGPVRANDSFAMLARAWSVVLAGTFGVIHVVMPRHRFLPRALAAIATTTMIAIIVLTVSGNGFEQLHTVVVNEIDQRLAASVDMVTQALSSPQWQRLAQNSPTFAKFAEDSTLQLQQFANVAKSTYAAVLAIESLAALAVTWALFHRVSRTRIGTPLAPLREFRFSDQLVWGLVVSIVLLVLPTFSGLRAMGLNLLIFFGALYALRGFAVLAWYFASHKVGLVLVMIVAILALPLTSLFSIGVGLGDTWLDWRGRPRITPRPPTPPQ